MNAPATSVIVVSNRALSEYRFLFLLHTTRVVIVDIVHHFVFSSSSSVRSTSLSSRSRARSFQPRVDTGKRLFVYAYRVEPRKKQNDEERG